MYQLRYKSIFTLCGQQLVQLLSARRKNTQLVHRCAPTQRVCIFTPAVMNQVTVSVVVCVPRMTCVTHAGSYAEMWRFSTSTRGWERVDNTSANRAGPNARFGHVMTSVGLDLWVHGGYTVTDSCASDACATRAPLLLLLR